jgi:hypothetical protein
MTTTTERIFLSHTGADKEFVRGLAQELRMLQYRIWLDEWEVAPGDSIVDKIFEGLRASDTIIVVLSPASVQSRWVKEELTAATMRRIVEANIRILPILIADCEIPDSIRHICYADFRVDFETGFARVLDAIAPLNRQWATLVHLNDLFCIVCDKLCDSTSEEQRACDLLRLHDLLESALDIRTEVNSRSFRRKAMAQSFFQKIESLAKEGLPVKSQTWNNLVHFRASLAHDMHHTRTHYQYYLDAMKRRYSDDESEKLLSRSLARLKEIMKTLCYPENTTK